MKKILLISLLLFLSTLCYAQGGMMPSPTRTLGGGGGITEVGSGSQRNSTSSAVAQDIQTISFPSNVTTGHLLVILGGVYNPAQPDIPTITSTCSSPFNVILGSGQPSHTEKTFIGYAVATSTGACTVSVDYDSPAAGDGVGSIAIDEFAGVTQLDVDGGDQNATSTTASRAVTTVATNTLVVGIMLNVTGGTLTLTQAGGYTLIAKQQDADTFIGFSAIFQIVSSASTYTPSWTISSSVLWTAQAASLKP